MKDIDWPSEIIRIIFVSVLTCIVSISLRPIISILPNNALFQSLGETATSELLLGLISLSIFVIITKVRRFDLILRRNIGWLSFSLAVLLVLGIWINSEALMSKGRLIISLFTFIVAFLYLRYCGLIIHTEMQTASEAQLPEIQAAREAEAKWIMNEAMAEGDPSLAAGIFAIDVAGSAGNAIGNVIIFIFASIFFFLAISIVAALNASFMYGYSFFVSVVIGFVIAIANIGAIGFSYTYGEQLSDNVPVEEKHKPILDR